MPGCNVQELMDGAACFACLPQDQKSTLELALLAQWNEYTGTTQELINSAACFACIDDPTVKSTLELALLWQIAVARSTCFTVETSSTPDAGSCTGTATVTPVGGVGPFEYRWDNGQITQTATGLCAGSYQCLVIDLGSLGVCADASTVVVDAA